MRRFIFLALLLGLAASIAIPLCHDTTEKPFPELMEHAINQAPLATYRHPMYGYVVRYPPFFEQLPDSLCAEPGACQFRYWDHWTHIELAAFVAENPLDLSPSEAAEQLARSQHATVERVGPDHFILSGPQHAGDSLISGHRFRAKYVRHRRLWFVIVLSYPEECTQAVARLRREIDDWRVWE